MACYRARDSTVVEVIRAPTEALETRRVVASVGALARTRYERLQVVLWIDRSTYG